MKLATADRTPVLSAKRGAAMVCARHSILWFRPCRVALVVALVMSVACAVASPKAEAPWPELARRVAKYVAKPSPETAKTMLDIIPETSVSFTGSKEEQDAIEVIYAPDPMRVLEQRVLMRERESVALAFRMRHIADGAFLEDLGIILGGLIQLDAELFLTELQRARISPPEMRGLVGNLGVDFADQMEKQCKEVRLRRQSLEKVTRASLKQTKDQALSALAADDSSCRDGQP